MIALEVNPSETIFVRPARRDPGEQETSSAGIARLSPSWTPPSLCAEFGARRRVDDAQGAGTTAEAPFPREGEPRTVPMEVSAAERKQDRLRGEVSIAVSGVAESAEFSWERQWGGTVFGTGVHAGAALVVEDGVRSHDRQARMALPTGDGCS